MVDVVVCRERLNMGVESRCDVVVIDDHEVICLGVERALLDAGVADSVRWSPDLASAGLTEESGQDVVAVLDLRLDDGSSPADNLHALSALNVPTVVYTSGEEPYLVRVAIAAGALSIVRKSAPMSTLVDAVRAAALHETMPNPDWAAALDADEDFVSQHLTPAEVRVLAGYASGETSDVVARELSMSRNTVNTYVARIRDKYRAVGRPVNSRVDLFRRAVEDGIVPVYSYER